MKPLKLIRLLLVFCTSSPREVNRPHPVSPAVVQPLGQGRVCVGWDLIFSLASLNLPGAGMRDKWQTVLYFSYLFLFVYNFTGELGRSRKSRKIIFWWKINSHWGDGWLGFHLQQSLGKLICWASYLCTSHLSYYLNKVLQARLITTVSWSYY